MRRSRLPVRRALATAVLALVVVAAQACAPGGGGGGGGKKGRKGKGANKRAAAAAAVLQGGYTGAAGGVKLDAAVEQAHGYIVRGTDFATFWPCGKDGYYFLLAEQMVNARIAQQYKFAASRPYIPMYAVLRLQYVNDTLSRGARHFDRYVRVVDYTPTSRTEAKCPSPSRAALSDEMQRLDGFKPEVLAR
jgi:hypothetical protein